MYYLSLFFHLRSTSQSTIMAVVLCHKRFGHPCSKCACGPYVFLAFQRSVVQGVPFSEFLRCVCGHVLVLLG